MSRKMRLMVSEIVAAAPGMAFRPEEWETAAKELRALLAVARAARPALGLMTDEKWDALQHALARLDKASATPRGDR